MQNYKNYSEAELHELVLGTLPTREQYRVLAQLLFDLYVTLQEKRLVQYLDKTTGKAEYKTEKALSGKKNAITTKELVRHVKGEVTYGVFAGKERGRFLCFDVDYEGRKPSEVWVKKLINSLKRHSIRDEQIHVSISGKKGYHVDLFFDDVIAVKTLELFYNHIITDIGADAGKIEFRATYGTGVKLPLGIHRVTGVYCGFVTRSFCELEYMSIKKSIEYLERAKENRISANSFKDMCEKLKPAHNTVSVKHEHTEKTEKTPHNASKSTNNVYESVEEAQAYCKELLTTRMLNDKGRHNATFKLTQYFKDIGYEEEETLKEVEAFITEAYENDRSKFDINTTLEHALSEVRRLTHFVYENGYSLYNLDKREWELYESELTFILEKVNSMPEKRKYHYIQLAFAFLMESKRHAMKSNDYVFYTTYKQLAKYGCDKTRSRLKKQIDRLVEVGILEIAKETERMQVKENNVKKVRNTPYYYKVHVPKEASDNNKLVITPATANEDKKIDTIITSLLAEEKVIKLVSKKIYYEHLKPLYSTKMA